MIRLILFAALLLVTSCRLPKQITGMKEGDNTDVKKNPDVENSSKKKPGHEIFKGLFFYDKNGESFRDCANPDSVYDVADSTGKLKDLYLKNFAQPNSYSTVVAEVQGNLHPTENSYIADKYPSTLVVSDVLLVEKKNGSNSCIPFEYWASGSNPEWTLEISKKENLIELNIPSEKKLYYFFYSDPVEQDGYIVYQNYNSIQRYLIEVKIKKEQCSDNSKGAMQEYSFEINLTGNINLKGCGHKFK